MAAITCRSPQEILDDELCAVHTDVLGHLNALCNGRCLYTGERRLKLTALRERIEGLILAGVDAAMDRTNIIFHLRCRAYEAIR